MRIVQRLARAPDPDDAAAARGGLDSGYPAVGGGQHRRAARREDVDAMMVALAAVTRRAEMARDRAAVEAFDRESKRRDDALHDLVAPAAKDLRLKTHEIGRRHGADRGQAGCSCVGIREAFGRAVGRQLEVVQEDRPGSALSIVRRW